MITRQDIEREYTVCNGEIMSKGKFDGEPVWAPYFWDLALHGEADIETENGDSQFAITKEQRLMWPELGRAKTILLAELDTGDVVTTTME